jgi:hypothetical protein
VLESRWWELEALCKLVSTRDTGDVERIYSLVPFIDEKALIARLSARSDLDTLLTLYCRGAFLEEQKKKYHC